MTDSIDEIQFRHDHTLIIDWYKETAPAQPQTAFNGAQCHDDRGYLLKEIQRLREATVYLYNSGYMAGHNDTVEACFTDIYECDMDTYHDDVVAELLTDKALEETK